MKIAFYGSSLLSSYWNGAATYYRGILGELPAFGDVDVADDERRTDAVENCSLHVESSLLSLPGLL